MSVNALLFNHYLELCFGSVRILQLGRIYGEKNGFMRSPVKPTGGACLVRAIAYSVEA